MDLQDHPDEPAESVAGGVPDRGEPGQSAEEGRRRRRPSTVGGAVYLLVLAGAGVGVAIVSDGRWRLGVKWIAASLIDEGARVSFQVVAGHHAGGRSGGAVLPGWAARVRDSHRERGSAFGLATELPAARWAIRAARALFDGADGRPVPTAFVAVTRNVYLVPFVKPRTTKSWLNFFPVFSPAVTSAVRENPRRAR